MYATQSKPLSLPTSRVDTKPKSKRMTVTTPASGSTPIRRSDTQRNRRKDFVYLMTKKYDTPTNGWRTLIDKNNQGAVTQAEFFRGMRDFGCRLNTVELWSELDMDQWGVVTLEDFAPLQARDLLELYSLLLEKSGNVEALLKKAAVGSDGSIPIIVFTSLCEDLPFKTAHREKHIYKLASYLNRNALTAGISANDVSWFHAVYCTSKRTRIVEEFIRLLKSKYEDEFVAFAAVDCKEGTMSLADFSTLCQPLTLTHSGVHSRQDHVKQLFEMVSTDGFLSQDGLRSLYVWSNYVARLRQHSRYRQESVTGIPPYPTRSLVQELETTVDDILNLGCEVKYLDMVEENIAILDDIQAKLVARGTSAHCDITHDLVNVELAKVAYHRAAQQLVKRISL